MGIHRFIAFTFACLCATLHAGLEGLVDFSGIRETFGANGSHGSYWKCGSGFFITHDGYLVCDVKTASDGKAYIVVYNGKAYEAKIVLLEGSPRISLLKVAGGRFHPAELAQIRRPGIGWKARTFGFDLTEEDELVPYSAIGVITKNLEGCFRYFAKTRPVVTGGAVVDEGGLIIGMVRHFAGGELDECDVLPASEIMATLPMSVRRKMVYTGGGKKEIVSSLDAKFAAAVLVYNDERRMAVNAASHTEAKPDNAKREMSAAERQKTAAWIRKQVLYARLAKVRQQWREVKKITDAVLDLNPGQVEAKILNDEARDNMGLHLVVLARVGERDVEATILPMAGFKEKRVRTGAAIALFNATQKHGFPVKARVEYDELGCSWVGLIDSVYDWHGTKEITVELQYEKKGGNRNECE